VLRRPVESAQYASYAYRRPAADFGMQTSMSRRANAWNNAAMESFFMTLKVERIYQCLARKASAFMPGMKSADAEGILAFEA
jgi:transposase InsO family protein